jgi:hypothetical protein
MNGHRNFSVAIFGSLARGDVDSLSDRDVFVVCDGHNDTTTYIAHLRRFGWSPTVYTWSRLHGAIRRGDLFIQHLRHEARIVQDPEDKLAHVLSKFKPRSSYKSERAGAAQLLRILEYLPDCDRSQKWVFDVGSVAFRSLAVAELAEHGLYCFSLQDMVKGLTNIGVAPPDLFRVVSRLRFGKKAYRSAIPTSDINCQEMKALLNAIDKCFGLGLHVQAIPCDRFVSRAISHTVEDLGWYAHSRMIEHVISQLRPHNEKSKNLFAEWNRILRAPSEYGGYLSVNTSNIANDLVRMLNTNNVRLARAA